MIDLGNKKHLIWLLFVVLLGTALLITISVNIENKNAGLREKERMQPAAQNAEPLTENQTPAADAEPGEFEELALEAQAMLQNQQAVNDSLSEELDSHTYTWQNPLIVTDPYGKSPLAALVLFETEDASQISVHVSGKTPQADVDFTFPGYNTRHIIPVYGLYADTENRVVLTAATAGGQQERQTISVFTEPLPNQLADLSITARLSLPDAYLPGFNFTYQPKAAYDVNGDYRWYFSDFNLMRTQSDRQNGRIIMSKGNMLMGTALLYEMDLLGCIYNVYYSPYGAHHDIARTQSGSLLVTGSDSGQDGKGPSYNLIYEIDTANGDIINTLDLSRVLQRTRASNTVYWPHDWFHNNSVLALEDGKIIVSGRHQSAVVKMSWPEGEIDWILSAPKGWNDLFLPYLLQSTGSDFEWPLCQHTPTVLPDVDNNPDTMDILLLDNGTDRFTDGGIAWRMGEGDAEEPYSRAVHYRIDEKAGTVEQIWQFGKELGERYYSERCGNTMRLENGSVFISFDVSRKVELSGRDPIMIYSNSSVEVLEGGDIVWESYISNTATSTGSYENLKTIRASFYDGTEENYRLDINPGYFVPEQEAAV